MSYRILEQAVNSSKKAKNWYQMGRADVSVGYSCKDILPFTVVIFYACMSTIIIFYAHISKFFYFL